MVPGPVGYLQGFAGKVDESSFHGSEPGGRVTGCRFGLLVLVGEIGSLGAGAEAGDNAVTRRDKPRQYLVGSAPRPVMAAFALVISLACIPGIAANIGLALISMGCHSSRNSDVKCITYRSASLTRPLSNLI